MSNVINKKGDQIAFISIILVFLLSSFTLEIFKSSLSLGGNLQIYFVELIFAALGVYVVLWQLLAKRGYRELSRFGQYLLIIAIIFAFYYIGTMSFRFITHQFTTGSFFLARVLLETISVYLSLEYFKVKPKVVIWAIISSFAIFTLMQYGLFFMDGDNLRGPSIVLGNSSVYNHFSNIVQVFILYLFYQLKNVKMRVALASIFLLNIPTLALTGSRTSIVIAFFSFVIISLFLTPSFTFKRKILASLAGCLIMIGIFAITLLAVSNENKAVMVRTISVPLKIVKAVTPESFDKKLDALFAFEVEQDKIKDLSTSVVYEDSNDYLKDSENVSKNQRSDVNTKAFAMINKNWGTFIFGAGTSLVHRYGEKFMKPHNYVPLYMLNFGLIGLLLSMLIFFAPLVLLFKRPYSVKVLTLLVYVPLLINAWLQPALGDIHILYLFFLVIYALPAFQDFYLKDNMT